MQEERDQKAVNLYIMNLYSWARVSERSWEIKRLRDTPIRESDRVRETERQRTLLTHSARTSFGLRYKTLAEYERRKLQGFQGRIARKRDIIHQKKNYKHFENK